MSRQYRRVASWDFFMPCTENDKNASGGEGSGSGQAFVTQIFSVLTGLASFFVISGYASIVDACRGHGMPKSVPLAARDPVQEPCCCGYCCLLSCVMSCVARHRTTYWQLPAMQSQVIVNLLVLTPAMYSELWHRQHFMDCTGRHDP